MNVTVVRQRPNVCYIHKWVIRVLIEFRKDRFGFGLRHNSQPWVQSQQLTAHSPKTAKKRTKRPEYKRRRGKMEEPKAKRPTRSVNVTAYSTLRKWNAFKWNAMSIWFGNIVYEAAMAKIVCRGLGDPTSWPPLLWTISRNLGHIFWSSLYES